MHHRSSQVPSHAHAMQILASMRGVGIIRRAGYAVSYSVPLLTVGTEFLPGPRCSTSRGSRSSNLPSEFRYPRNLYSTPKLPYTTGEQAECPLCYCRISSRRSVTAASAEMPRWALELGAWRVDCHECHGIEESKSPRLGYPGA